MHYFEEAKLKTCWVTKGFYYEWDDCGCSGAFLLEKKKQQKKPNQSNKKNNQPPKTNKQTDKKTSATCLLEMIQICIISYV